MEARERQVPQVERSQEEEGGLCSWSKARSRGAGREVRAVREGGHLKGFVSGSEEMGTLTGTWPELLHKPMSLVLC